MLTVLTVVLLVGVMGLLVWLITNQFETRKEASTQSIAITALAQQVETLRTGQETTRQTVDKTLQTGQENIWKSLEKSHTALVQLHQQIGEMQGASKQLVGLSTDVRRLNDILHSPKLRGQMGEWSLERLLSELLPQESFELQYRFSDGKIVDALIKLADFSVSVDAKFPLPSFEAMLKADPNNGELVRAQRQFGKDVTTHIDKIAESYIRPAEGTLDFALMYIPAENVYYETIIKNEGVGSITEYAMGKKVIPVSPNVLYAYVMTVVMGLHGLQIEKQAGEIRENLKRLDGSFSLFAADFKTLGNHIRLSGNKFDEADKKLNKFESQLNCIKTGDES